jgi:nondiscriminating glutamyl-tRNA synthetase
MEFKNVRVRYAPSPTGMLHIGGARSALYNYLFAKKYGGQFLVRIEDTDIKRNISGGEDSQLDGLAWLGIIPDESPKNPNPKYAPYRQTERLELYQKLGNKLIDLGHAYHCYCTEEELEVDREEQTKKGATAGQYSRRCLHASSSQIEAWKKEGRKPVIRLKLKDHYIIKFNDLIRGEVAFNNDDIGDWVILKSNGIPTYNYAVVIDDHYMGITHVFRGEEHLPNTSRQIQLFEYFDWTIPTYGHMTLIVNEEGKKLSKRDPHIVQFIQQYKEMGYLPEAIFNFILLLGWSPEEKREIFSREEAIAAFKVERLSKAPSMFDVKKLEWINNEYIKKLNEENLFNLCYPFLSKGYDLTNRDKKWINLLFKLLQPKLGAGKDIVDLAREVFFQEPLTEVEAIEFMKAPEASKTLTSFKKVLNSFDNITQENVQEILKQVQLDSGNKGKMLFMPLRIALTSKMHGPDFNLLLQLLGKTEIFKRLGN